MDGLTPMDVGEALAYLKEQSNITPNGNGNKPRKTDFITGVMSDAEGLKRTLDEGLKAIDTLPDVAMRSVAFVQLRKSLQLGEKEFLSLIHQLAEHQEGDPLHHRRERRVHPRAGAQTPAEAPCLEAAAERVGQLLLPQGRACIPLPGKSLSFDAPDH